MSYEGYEVCYCENGHFIGTRDVYDVYEENVSSGCPVCGSKSFVYFQVDLTNGCWCDEMSEEDLEKHGRCPAHAPKFELSGYDSVVCTECQGTGDFRMVRSYYRAECRDCTEETRNTCSTCKGTGVIHEDGETIFVDCGTCKGDGKIRVPRYNLAKRL